MTKEEILKWAKTIKGNPNDSFYSGYVSEIKELIKSYIGKNNSFYEELNEINPNWYHPDAIKFAFQTLEKFIKVVENDFISTSSFHRKIQTDVISDILEQAQNMFEESKIHPACPAMLIGAALEEFLRNWVEEQAFSLENKKPSIDSYAKILKENDLITKQDIKDITSWAGIRNDAAHGKWEEIDDVKRIKLMFEGVNYFMRKYS